MKKDKIYSLRMNSKVRDALQRASNKEQRSVASLMDKIIMDYLTREGFLSDADYGVERRQFNRKKITVPTETTFTEGQTQKAVPGVVLDLSLGGALITYPKSSDVRFSSVGKLPEFGLELQVPGQTDVLHFDCNAKHMRDTGEEIHVGASFRNPKDKELQKLNDYLSDKQPEKKDR